MNILLIHTHDTGRYIEPYGHDVKTPALMEFAKEGILFEDAHCASPTCSPSRAALMTGQYPHNNGMIGLAHFKFVINDYSKHLVNVLNRNGYETVLAGTQHEAVSSAIIGYSKDITDYKSYGDKFVGFDVDNANKACEYLSLQHTKPFFLSFGMFDTHRPFPDIDKQINADDLRLPVALPDNNDIRKDYAAFATAVNRMDKRFAEVYNALKKSKYYENTIVIFTTDHGIPFPRMKCHLYDSGTGVSLIIKVPGINRIAKTNALISQIDIFPTLCELCSIKKPSYLQGHSFVSVLKGEKEEVNEEIFCEVNYHGCYEPMRNVRTKRYNYIRYYGDEKRKTIVNTDGSISRDFFIYNAYYQGLQEKEELYDLHIDSSETNNLINEKKYNEVLLKIRKKLEENMRETNDPLIDGDASAPADAMIHPWD